MNELAFSLSLFILCHLALVASCVLSSFSRELGCHSSPHLERDWGLCPASSLGGDLTLHGTLLVRHQPGLQLLETISALLGIILLLSRLVDWNWEELKLARSISSNNPLCFHKASPAIKVYSSAQYQLVIA